LDNLAKTRAKLFICCLTPAFGGSRQGIKNLTDKGFHAEIHIPKNGHKLASVNLLLSRSRIFSKDDIEKVADGVFDAIDSHHCRGEKIEIDVSKAEIIEKVISELSKEGILLDMAPIIA